MYNTACVVNLCLLPSFPSPRSCSVNPRSSLGTCCGILMDTEQGLILAHASCLGLFVEQGDIDLTKLTLTLKEDQRVSCEVLLQKKEEHSERLEEVSGVPMSSDVDTDIAHIDVLHSENDITSKNRQAKKYTHSFCKFPASVVHFFHCSTLRESLQTLMPEPTWELGDRKDDKTNNKNDSHRSAQREADIETLLSSFIILRLQEWRPYISQLLIRPTRDCIIGEKVEICSTPFGGLKPDAFINSYSRGVVSNLAGKDNCLLLSDARCILGGEGAPLYTFYNHTSSSVRCVTGVVVASLCWKNQEWVGFCVACDLSAVLQSAAPFLQHLCQSHGSRSLSRAVEGCAASQGVCCPEVVMVKVGSTWGSGVVVDADRGIIITCSHVIKEAHLFPVEVQRYDAQVTGKTKVLYRQHPVSHQFDLAVMQVLPPFFIAQPSSTQSLTVADPEEGMEVFVVGHALFGAEHHLPPSVTSGVISKVIRVNSVPVMIQTTCAVHPGASGGALVDTRGRLLAIIVCNTRDNSCGASFPHVNMSIPVCIVWPVIARFLHTQDVRHLEKLRVKNKKVDTIWALGSLHDTGMTTKISKL